MNKTSFHLVEVTKIPDDEGGGYSACIPLLGRNAFISDGETIDEALENLITLLVETVIQLKENININQR